MGSTGKERAARAFQAMEELGLERKFVTPILRELLKVYNNEWSYIEAENYRLLADQAFEQQETMVKPEGPSSPTSPASPRRTRSSLSGSASAAEKGKMLIECGDTRSSEECSPREANNPSIGASRGVSKPPLFAQVKVEKDADGTPPTLHKTPVIERVNTRAMVEKREIVKVNETNLDRTPAATTIPSPTTSIIDAHTLEETLKLVASTSSLDICAATRSTAVVNDTHPTVGLVEERPQTSSPVVNDTHPTVGLVEEKSQTGAGVVIGTHPTFILVEEKSQTSSGFVNDTHPAVSMVEKKSQTSSGVVNDTHPTVNMAEEKSQTSTVVVNDTHPTVSMVEDKSQTSSVVVNDTHLTDSMAEEKSQIILVVENDTHPTVFMAEEKSQSSSVGVNDTHPTVSMGEEKSQTSSAIVNETHPTVSLVEEKSQSIKDNFKAENLRESMEPICRKVTEFQCPGFQTTICCHAVESSSSEPGSDRSIGEGGGGVVAQHCLPKVVNELTPSHTRVRNKAKSTFLLGEYYHKDKEESQLAEVSVILPISQLPPVKELQDVLVLEAGNPDSSSLERSHVEQLEQSILSKQPEEELLEQPLDMDLSVEEEPEQLDSLETDLGPQIANGRAEGIRPGFIVNKKEVLVAADEDLKSIPNLVRKELETTLSNVKRELSDAQESIERKRLKYDKESVDNLEISVDQRQILEDKEECAIPPCTYRTPSPSPADCGDKLIVGNITSAGASKRKLILSESPSPEAKVLVTSRVTRSRKSNSCASTAGCVEVEGIFCDSMSVANNRTVSCRSSDMEMYDNCPSATVAVNTVLNPEDFDDEPQDSRKILAHSTADISRGTERMVVSYVNDYSSDTIATSFKYIPVNTAFQDAYVNFSLARVGEEDCCGGCLGNCLKARFPCTCTRETGGVFAYTVDGLLKDEFLQHEVDAMQDEEVKVKRVTFCASGWECPTERAKNNTIPDSCKGHLSRKFIKECWHKCGCSMDCGNRVVQRGISRQLQVFFTQEGKGWGLRTLEELPAGAFICEYVGEILTNIELDKRNNAQKGASTGTHTYPILLDGDWCSEKGLKDEEALCLDATYFGNAARFINHRCFDANLIDMPVTVESPDRHYYHVAFFTSRIVKALEELTWDYKIDFDDDEHPIEAFRCLCKSPFCRGSPGKKRKKNVQKFNY